MASSASAGSSSSASAKASSSNNNADHQAKIEEMKRSRLELLKTTRETVHIISTPFSSEEGKMFAKRVADYSEPKDCEHKGVKQAFCYNPNEDCPQTLGISWLKTWMAICNNTKTTGGKVFVIYRSDGKGGYGCAAKGSGSLDGQAQEGEIEYALSKGCAIHWMDQTDPEAAMLLLRQESSQTGSHANQASSSTAAAAATSVLAMSSGADTSLPRSADALIFICNPTHDGSGQPITPLPAAQQESRRARDILAAQHWSVMVQDGGDAEVLRCCLQRFTPRLLLFIGHADATATNTRLTLGLSAPNGGLVRMLPDTLAHITAACASLELIILNGCRSAELAEACCCAVALHKRVLAAISWRTILLDEAAATFSRAVLEHLATAGPAGVLDAAAAAFEQGRLAVVAKRNREGTEKYALDDPFKYRQPDGTVHGRLPDGRMAVGEPLLLKPLSSGRLLDVPPLPSCYVARDEQCKMREVLHCCCTPILRARSTLQSALGSRALPVWARAPWPRGWSVMYTCRPRTITSCG